METALETAISGYINRKLDYFMLDITASYNSEIRFCNSLLLNPCYAGNNIDVKYQK